MAPSGAVWLALSLVIVGVGLWNIYNTHYRVTEQRVIRRLGILSRRVSTIELKDVRNVQTVQTVLDRLLDVGDVLISSAGQSDVEIEFSGVRNPSAVAGMIRDRRGEP